MADKVISDTHFFDPLIIRHTKRGVIDRVTGKKILFKDEYVMNSHIVKSWNSTVSEKDTVFHLGDLFYDCSFEQAEIIFNNLNGKIVLILGNHDREISGMLPKLKALPFEAIIPYPVIYERFILSHEPLKRCENFINIHGHSHGKGNTGIDVCAELLDYRPVSICSLLGKKNNLYPKQSQRKGQLNGKGRKEE